MTTELPPRIGDLIINEEIVQSGRETMVWCTCTRPGCVREGKPFTRRRNRIHSTLPMCPDCAVAERQKPRCRACGKLDHATSNCPDKEPKTCPVCLGLAHRAAIPSCRKCGLVYEAEKAVSTQEQVPPVPRYQPAKVVAPIRIEAIRRERDVQSRVELVLEAVVEEYVEKIEAGEEFPPPVVYFDGKIYWLAEGYQRVEAHQRAGRNTIECEIKMGGIRDAILHSVGANAKHGAQRTAADKRRAVNMLFNDTEWKQRSDHWIASTCSVAQSFVSKLRREQLTSSSVSSHRPSSPPPQPTPAVAPEPIRREGMDGKIRRLPTAASFSVERALRRMQATFDAIVTEWPDSEPVQPLINLMHKLTAAVDDSHRAQTKVREKVQA